MKKELILSVFGWIPFFSVTAFASDSVIVRKDSRLDILTAKQILFNKRTAMMTSNGLYKGFRIQVISTNSRDKAFKERALLLARFPELKTYVTYHAPTFKVRAGNFVKREDAEKMRNQMARFYPQGIYVVEDTIDYVPEDETPQLP